MKISYEIQSSFISKTKDVMGEQFAVIKDSTRTLDIVFWQSSTFQKAVIYGLRGLYSIDFLVKTTDLRPPT